MAIKTQHVYRCEIEFEDKPTQIWYHARTGCSTQKGRERQLDSVTNFFVNQWPDRPFKRLTVQRQPSL